MSPSVYKNRAGDVEWEGPIDDDFFIPLVERPLLDQTKEVYKKYVYDWGSSMSLNEYYDQTVISLTLEESTALSL
jgi:hypothetical protein